MSELVALASNMAFGEGPDAVRGSAEDARCERETLEGHMMRVCVVGTGVVGSYFGGQLTRAGEDVVFQGRGANLRAIREHGLRVGSVDGDFVVRPAQATDASTRSSPTAVGERDLGRDDFVHGKFGENFTLDGLPDDDKDRAVPLLSDP
jgi:Ketopantoate reductase PanE/ApbA